MAGNRTKNKTKEEAEEWEETEQASHNTLYFFFMKPWEILIICFYKPSYKIKLWFLKYFQPWMLVIPETWMHNLKDSSHGDSSSDSKGTPLQD